MILARKPALIALSIAISTRAGAGDEHLHLLDKPGYSRTPVTIEKLSDRIDSTAVQYARAGIVASLIVLRMDDLGSWVKAGGEAFVPAQGQSIVSGREDEHHVVPDALNYRFLPMSSRGRSHWWIKESRCCQATWSAADRDFLHGWIFARGGPRNSDSVLSWSPTSIGRSISHEHTTEFRS